MFLKKSRFAELICLIMCFAVPLASLAAPAITDVSKDHWAYEAVIRLVEKGYLGVYEDGSFKGEEGVSRYLLAFVVAKMLSDLEKGATTATDEDMSVLRQVANELRAELVPLLTTLDLRVDTLEKAALDNSKTITAERQERKAEANEILSDMEDYGKRILELNTSIVRTEKSLEAVDAALSQGATARVKADAELAKLSVELDTLKKTLSADIDESVAQLIKSLENEIAERSKLEGRVSALEDETIEDLAAAMASIRQWADEKHSELSEKLEARISEAEASSSKALSDEADALRKAVDAEDAAIKTLITASKSDGLASISNLQVQIDAVKAALADTDSKAEAFNRELMAIKGALGQDIQKAVSDLSSYIEAETGSRKVLEAKLTELSAKIDKQGSDIEGIGSDVESIGSSIEGLRKWAEEEHRSMSAGYSEKTGQLERSQAALEESLRQEVAALKAELVKDNEAVSADLAASVETLKAYISDEARLRAQDDALLSEKLEQVNKVLGADIEKAVMDLQGALSAESKDRKNADATLDAKLATEVANLKKALYQQDSEAKVMMLSNAVELQEKDSEMALSIAELRVLFDAANVSLTSIKERMASAEGRLGKLETSVDVLRSSIETNSKLLVTLSDDLARLKSKQEVLEIKVSDLQAKNDAFSKEIATVKSDQGTEISGAKDELNAKLLEQEKAFQKTIDDLKTSNEAQMKQIQGLGITGLVVGILGLIAGIVAMFLPTP